MLHIVVSCSGKLDKPYWAQACGEYSKRLTAHCKLEFHETQDGKNPKWYEKHHTVALTADGVQYDSPGFAALLQSWQNRGISRICFYVGGSDGLSHDFTERCDGRLSLSAMTWPHAVARVLLLEQLYRGFQILGNTAYHK